MKKYIKPLSLASTPINKITTPQLEVMLTDMKAVLVEAVMDGETVVTPEIALTYGQFLQTVVDFLIIAFSIFFVLRIMVNAQKKFEALTKKAEEVAPVEEAPAEPEVTELTLLTEIRDLLNKQ